MKDEDKRLLTFVLATLFHVARIIRNDVNSPVESFDSAEAFLDEAKKRDVLPSLPG